MATTQKNAPVKLDPPPEIKLYKPFAYTAQGIGGSLRAGAVRSGGRVGAAAGTGGAESNYTVLRPDPNRVRELSGETCWAPLKMMAPSAWAAEASCGR